MHKTYKLLLLNLSIILLFLGCTPPSAFSFFKKDELKASALQYTKVTKIVKEGQVKATMNATYLNSVDNDFDDENQNFIIGIFLSNDTKEEREKYHVTLNDRNATYNLELSDQHKMYGHIPMYNSWAKYNLLKFDTNDSEINLNLKLVYTEVIETNSTLDSSNLIFDSSKDGNKTRITTSNVNFEAE